jgi:DNA-binding GntR family transcriptional regulator
MAVSPRSPRQSPQGSSAAMSTLPRQDRKFHRLIVGLLGNRLLTEMAMNLRDNTRLYSVNGEAGLARQRASVEERRQLLRLLAAHDAAAIEPAMRRHIGSWRGIFAAGLTK